MARFELDSNSCGSDDDHDMYKYRYIVDRDITDNVIDGIFLTVQDAVNRAH